MCVDAAVLVDPAVAGQLLVLALPQQVDVLERLRLQVRRRRLLAPARRPAGYCCAGASAACLAGLRRTRTCRRRCRPRSASPRPATPRTCSRSTASMSVCSCFAPGGVGPYSRSCSFTCSVDMVMQRLFEARIVAPAAATGRRAAITNSVRKMPPSAIGSAMSSRPRRSARRCGTPARRASSNRRARDQDQPGGDRRAAAPMSRLRSRDSSSA